MNMFWQQILQLDCQAFISFVIMSMRNETKRLNLSCNATHPQLDLITAAISWHKAIVPECFLSSLSGFRLAHSWKTVVLRTPGQRGETLLKQSASNSNTRAVCRLVANVKTFLILPSQTSVPGPATDITAAGGQICHSLASLPFLTNWRKQKDFKGPN